VYIYVYIYIYIGTAAQIEDVSVLTLDQHVQ